MDLACIATAEEDGHGQRTRARVFKLRCGSEMATLDPLVVGKKAYMHSTSVAMLQFAEYAHGLLVAMVWMESLRLLGRYMLVREGIMEVGGTMAPCADASMRS